VAGSTAIDFEAMLSARTRAIDVSGIRRVFELGAKLENPINFSIGQPDFAVPEAIKQATIEAIRSDCNGYTLTQGDPALREAVARRVATDVGWTIPSDDVGVMVTSGTSGAILLAFLSVLDPGDEVIIPDPFFVIYPALGVVSGAKIVFCDTYPDFRMTAERVEPLITPRTKILLVNSPSNPCGVVLTGRELRDLAELCEARGVLIVADEIYDQFAYSDALEDGRCPSAARYTDRMLLVRGFGKTYGCTGWRMGFAAGPLPVIQQMSKLQQYTFVCAPSMAQRGLVGAFDIDVRGHVAAYEAKRDLVERMLGPVADIAHPGGAFYAWVRVPPEVAPNATAFVEQAIERNVLTIPGSVFSSRDTHLRLSYAVPDEPLAAGLRILRGMLARS
jgi:aspartate/methionine/tyrosine aminotransferase